MKRLSWLTVMLTMLFGSAGSTVASPPIGDQTPEYYAGIWRMQLDDICYRHDDGTGTALPLTTLFLALSWNDQSRSYSADLYADLDGARSCDAAKKLGEGSLDFEFPGGEASYLVEGFSTVAIDGPGFTGNCELSLQGVLRTAVRSSQIPMRSWMMGGNLGWCRADEEDGSAIGCSGAWVARWIEIPAECTALGDREGERSISICAGETVPASYIWVNDRWDPSQCGNPSAITYNVWLLEKYSDKPVGSTMTVCDAAPTPSGWVKVSDKWDPQRCGHPAANVNNVKTIKRLE